MPAHDDLPFRFAATLAVTLMSEGPKLTKAGAIAVAWHTSRTAFPSHFRTHNYTIEVDAAIEDIQSGRKDRVELSPEILQKALAIASKR